MTVIKDGTGTGYLAKVDNENRIVSYSTIIEESAHVSQVHGKVFIIFGTTTIVAATEKTIIILINNSSTDIAIERIRQSVQPDSGKPATIKLYLGKKTYSSGGTTRTPVNLNNTSSEIIDVSAYYDNPILGDTDTQINQIYMESVDTLLMSVGGLIILGKGSSIRSTCTGFAGATGKEITTTITYYATEIDSS